PAIQAAREAARRAQCTSHQKQLGVALHNYLSSQKRFPPGLPNCSPISQQWHSGGSETNGAVCVGPNWLSAILDYMEEPAIARNLRVCLEKQFNPCDDCEDNVKAGHIAVYNVETPPNFICPSAPAITMRLIESPGVLGIEDLGKGHYAGNLGANSYAQAV